MAGDERTVADRTMDDNLGPLAKTMPVSVRLDCGQLLIVATSPDMGVNSDGK
jgi:hypothetical protein